MKRITLWTVFAVFASLAFAEGVESSWFKSQTSRYSVMAESSQTDADLAAKTLEAYYGIFNSYFHFDENLLKERFNVRYFATKEGFDAYLSRLLGKTRDDFVYLHYSSQEKCELVLFPKDPDGFRVSLAHQGFVQFLKAFVSAPPIWLREGFAVFFEQLKFDERSGIAMYRENLSWLETVKVLKAGNELFPVQDLMLAGQDEATREIDAFYPQSWMLVGFLVNTDQKNYNRFLWDAVASLKKDGTLEGNSLIVARKAESWVGFDSLDTQFRAYVDSRKTFAELVSEGIAHYSDKNYDKADAAFTQANRMDDQHYVPYYYLGLVSYYRKDFVQAETFYRTALLRGCDPGIANYALGISAYSDNRFEDAKAFLAAAKTASPDKYTAKADELLLRIK